MRDTILDATLAKKIIMAQPLVTCKKKRCPHGQQSFLPAIKVESDLFYLHKSNSRCQSCQDRGDSWQMVLNSIQGKQDNQDIEKLKETLKTRLKGYQKDYRELLAKAKEDQNLVTQKFELKEIDGHIDELFFVLSGI